MTQMITRTITTYTYIFGKFNVKTGTVEDMEQRVFTHKLGAREESKLTRQIGKNLIHVGALEQLYGMSLDDFLLNAHVVVEREVEKDETRY